MKPQKIIKSVISKFLTIIVGTFILLVYAAYLTILSPIYLYCFILCKWGPYLNSSLGKMVTARGQFPASDNFTSTQSPRANLVVCAVVEGNQTDKRLKEIVTENVINHKLSNGKLKYPELTQYVTKWPGYFGFYFWKHETNFNLDEHVFHHQPSQSLTDDDLQNFMERLLNEPFENEKSPWKVFVTNNYLNPNISCEEMTLVTIKMHHSISDAYGLLYMMIEHLGGGIAAHAIPNFKKRTVWQTITFPFQAIYELVKFSALINMQSHPWKIGDDKKSWKQLYGKSKIIQVQNIKDIRNRLDVSFAAVVTSAFVAACHKTLKDQFGIVKKQLPTVFVLPLPDHPKILRNHATAAYTPLPVTESDCLTRLKCCHEAIEKAKSSVFPIIGKYPFLFGGLLTTGLSSFIGKNRQIPVGITNFPISSVQYEVVERKLLQVSAGGGALPGDAGMACCVYSYVDGVQFGIVVESALMSRKELKQFIQYIEDEIDILYDLSVI